MEDSIHLIAEGVLGLALLFMIQVQISTSRKQTMRLVERIVKRIETLLRDESVIHILIKEKLEVLQLKNREDLRQVVADIISIITKQMK